MSKALKFVLFFFLANTLLLVMEIGWLTRHTHQHAASNRYVHAVTFADMALYGTLLPIRFFSVSDKRELFFDPLLGDATKAGFVYGE